MVSTVPCKYSAPLLYETSLKFSCFAELVILNSNDFYFGNDGLASYPVNKNSGKTLFYHHLAYHFFPEFFIHSFDDFWFLIDQFIF